MDFLQRLEIIVAKWYAYAPHLPVGGRKWLTNNVWWIALVGAILSVLGLVIVVPAMITAMLLVSFGGLLHYNGSTLAGTWFSLLLSLISSIVTAVLLVMAVNPLKAKSRSGWKLLFLLAVFNLLLDIINGVGLLSVLSLVTGAIAAVVSGYFLFEIRDYFGAVTKVKSATVKPLKKSAKKSQKK